MPADALDMTKELYIPILLAALAVFFGAAGYVIEKVLDRRYALKKEKRAAFEEFLVSLELLLNHHVTGEPKEQTASIPEGESGHEPALSARPDRECAENERADEARGRRLQLARQCARGPHAPMTRTSMTSIGGWYRTRWSWR